MSVTDILRQQPVRLPADRVVALAGVVSRGQRYHAEHREERRAACRDYRKSDGAKAREKARAPLRDKGQRNATARRRYAKDAAFREREKARGNANYQKKLAAEKNGAGS